MVYRIKYQPMMLDDGYLRPKWYERPEHSLSESKVTFVT